MQIMAYFHVSRSVLSMKMRSMLVKAEYPTRFRLMLLCYTVKILFRNGNRIKFHTIWIQDDIHMIVCMWNIVV